LYANIALKIYKKYIEEVRDKENGDGRNRLQAALEFGTLIEVQINGTVILVYSWGKLSDSHSPPPRKNFHSFPNIISPTSELARHMQPRCVWHRAFKILFHCWPDI